MDNLRFAGITLQSAIGHARNTPWVYNRRATVKYVPEDRPMPGQF